IELPGQKQGFGFVGFTGPVVLSADGKLVATRSFDQTVYVFDTATGKEFRQLNEQPRADNPGGGFGVAYYGGFRTPIAFSPDGAHLATVGTVPGTGGGGVAPGQPFMQPKSAIYWWSLSAGSKARRFDNAERGILNLAVSPDGRTVVSANADNSFSVWEVLTGKECLHIKLAKDEKKPAQPPHVLPVPVGFAGGGGFGPGMSSAANPLAISRDGRTLVTAGYDRA